MAAVRTLFRKYWIILIILIWVIAWANRDWLAGGSHSAAEDPGEEVAQGEPEVEAEAAPQDTGLAFGPSRADPRASLAGDRTEERATPTHEAEAVQPAPAFSPGVERPRVAAPAEADPAGFRAEEPAPAAVAPETAPAAPAEAPPAPTALPADAAPEAQPMPPVAVTEGSREGTSPAQSVAAPETRPVEARAETAVSRAPELLARSRSVARSYGPRAGAEALAAGLRELPPDAPERADLYGELGNLHFAAGNFTAALAAYDSALRVLPDEERATMVRRLGPTYDRYHPSGRSHLEQFR